MSSGQVLQPKDLSASSSTTYKYLLGVSICDNTGTPVIGSSASSGMPTQDLDLIERYRATGFDVYKFTGTRTGSTTLTFTALSGMTVTNNDIIQIIQRTSAGVYVVVDMTTIVVSGTAPNYTITAAGGSFGATDTFTIYVRSEFRAYNSLSDALKVSEVSDLSEKYTTGIIYNYTNLATGSYPSTSGIQMLNKNHLFIGGFITEGGTDTSSFQIEVTSAISPAAYDWAPIYFYDAVQDLFVNTITVTGTTGKFAIFIDRASFTAFRIAFTSAAASNTVSIQYKAMAI